MLSVIDLSNHQKGIRLESLICDAFIFKATEGTYFIDSACDVFVQEAKELNKPYGVYHFLDQSDVKEQAHFFLDHIKGYIGEALLVLDYEGYGKQGAKKAKEFLDIIYEETGVKPLIYMNESDANGDDWSEVVRGDYDLWVAKYSKQEPHTPQWLDIAMWQYTDTPLDHSYFYGDSTAWYAYARSIKEDNKHKENYHTKGKRFKALKDLILKLDETWKVNTGMTFSKNTIFDIEQICHTKTTTHARILYNHTPVFVTLHKDSVVQVN